MEAESMHINKLRGLLLALAIMALPVHALTLKIATLAPAGTAWMQEMQQGAEAIGMKTNGRVKLKFYPGGVMGTDSSVHRKIRINQLQGGAFSASGLGSVDTGIQALSLPMLFRNFDEVDKVRAQLDERIKRHVADSGFIVLGISEGGFARIMSSKPIHNMDDIRASKVWIPEGDPLVEETFKAMGISAIPLPIADVFTGLQTGLIETIAATPTGALAFQWHSKIRHMVDLPVLYVIGVLAVSDKAFSRINEADQAIVIAEMQTVFKRLDGINRNDNLAATEALKAQGIEAITPTADEIMRWQAYSDTSIDAMVNNGSIDKGIVETIRELLQTIRQP
jgi:TRAP-type C4-dicarboxylate transport system substrate-binding protein